TGAWDDCGSPITEYRYAWYLATNDSLAQLGGGFLQADATDNAYTGLAPGVLVYAEVVAVNAAGASATARSGLGYMPAPLYGRSPCDTPALVSTIAPALTGVADPGNVLTTGNGTWHDCEGTAV